jgi:hypothetical protein
MPELEVIRLVKMQIPTPYNAPFQDNGRSGHYHCSSPTTLKHTTPRETQVSSGSGT